MLRWWMVALWVLFARALWAQAPEAPEVAVKSYVLMDAASGQVLAAKDADLPLPPASITKLMTAYLVFEALQQGQITLEDLVPISQNAYQQKGSRMFLEVGKPVRVDDLLQGLIVQSGNDAGVALAEYVGGGVEPFVARMNDAARRLGLQHTQYLDPVGLGGDGHYSTAADIATLSRHLINDFPQYYHYYGQKSFTWNKIEQPNRNRLLFSNAQVDGLKTGHTAAAGYCLASSEKRGKLRLIAVVLGAEKEAQRYEASQALLNDGFDQFREVTLLRDDQILKHARVWRGESDAVPVRAAQTISTWLPRDAPNSVTASVQIPTLHAPLAAGEKIGTITLRQEGKILAEVDALAAQTVAEAGFFGRTWDSIKLFFTE